MEEYSQVIKAGDPEITMHIVYRNGNFRVYLSLAGARMCMELSRMEYNMLRGAVETGWDMIKDGGEHE